MTKYLPGLAVISAAILWSLDGYIRQNLSTLPSFFIISLEHIIGALIFSFNSAKLNLINHTQLQPLLLIPLISWLLILSHDECNRNKHRIQAYIYPFVAVIFYHLQLWTSFYVAWFYTIILIFGLLVLLTTHTARTYLMKFVKNNLNIITFA